MGAGISLGEEQMACLIKRDMAQLFEKKIQSLPPCSSNFESYRLYLETNHHKADLRHVDVYANKSKQIRNAAKV